MAVVPLIALLSLWLVQGDGFVQPGPPDFCLQGPFHKTTPGPEEEEFTECLSWQNNTCCNVALSESISRHKAVGLYNYSWDLCGTLSPQCEEFIKVRTDLSQLVRMNKIESVYYVLYTQVSKYFGKMFTCASRKPDLTAAQRGSLFGSASSACGYWSRIHTVVDWVWLARLAKYIKT